MTTPRPSRSWIGPILLLGLVVLVLAACAPLGATPVPSGSPGASAVPTPTPAAAIPLTPATPGADPIALLAWLFTPIFWVLFNVLVVLDIVAS